MEYCSLGNLRQYIHDIRKPQLERAFAALTGGVDIGGDGNASGPSCGSTGGSSGSGGVRVLSGLVAGAGAGTGGVRAQPVQLAVNEAWDLGRVLHFLLQVGM